MRNKLRLSWGLPGAVLCLLWLGLLRPETCSAAALPPVITTQPMSQSVPIQGSVTFTVVVSSQSTLSYQWLKNSANISGATSSSYSIASVQTTDAGTYSVKVTNLGGNVTSSGATLTIVLPPGITTQPQNQAVAQGQSPSFSVVATGTTPLSYQWYFNGTAISGSTGTICTISNAQPANAGNYTVGINNAAGTVISSNAVLTVVNPIILADNTSSAFTNGTTLSWSHTVGNGANRILLVGVAIHSSVHTVTSVTYGGLSLTSIGQSVDGGDKVMVVLYRLLAPPVGTNNVNVVIDSNERMSGGAVSFSGVSQYSPTGLFAAAGGSGLSGAVSLSSATNEVVVDIMGATGDALTLTSGGNQVPRWNNGSGTGAGDALGASSSLIGSPTTTMSWSLGVLRSWALGAVALKPAPALQADVRTTQTGPTNVLAGANYTCTITVTNAGPAGATNIVLTDTLPAGAAFFNASGGGSSNNGVVTWPAFNLANSYSTNFTLTLTAPARGSLTNTVSSSADTYDPDSSSNDGSAAGAFVVTAVRPFDASFAGSSCAKFNDATNLTWSQTVNTGNNRMLIVGISLRQKASIVSSVTYGGVALTNLVSSRIKNAVEIWGLVGPPTGTANIVVNWSGTSDMVGWSGAFTNVDQSSPVENTGSAANGSMAPSVTLNASSGDMVVDTVSTMGDALWLTPGAGQTGICNDGIGINATDGRGASSYEAGAASTTMSWTLGASRNWDIAAVALKAAPAPLQADVATTVIGPASVFDASNLTYTISTTNLGPSTASNVEVSDTLPAGVTFISASGGGVNSNGVVTWMILSLPCAAATNFTVTVTAPVGGTLTNTVASTSTTSDPDSSNNNGTAAAARIVTTVTPLADVGVFMTGPAASVLPGANYNYSITVTNFGPSPASGVSVTNSLPGNVTFVGATGGGVTNGSQVVWNNIGSLASGAASNLTLTVTAPLRGSVTSVASVASLVLDPNPVNNTAPPVTTTVSNLPPVANNDNYTTPEDTPLTVVAASGVLANDTDANGDTLTALLVTGPANGTLTLSTNGSFTYTPGTYYRGPDSFTYRASDGTTNSGPATVSITVTPVNHPPVANSQSVATPAATAKAITLTGSDVDNDPLTFSIVSGPTNGVLSGLNTTSGTVTYTPNTKFSGPDSFTFRVNDGTTNSPGATVSLTVTSVADIATTVMGPALVAALSNFNYTITVTNLGISAASGVAVSNRLPAAVVFVSASGGGLNYAGVVTWPALASLAKGAATNFTVTVTAPASGALTNTVFSIATTSDPDSSNNDGTAAAATVVTLVCTPPTIATQPQSQTVDAGDPATLNVTATGTGPLYCQWQFNGIPLPNATNATLVLPNVHTNNAGSYRVVVTNSVGSVTSMAAMLTVTNPAPPSMAAATMTLNGFTFQLSVPAGHTYVILATTNLQDWIPIFTNVVLTGSVAFTDTSATNNRMRFYRGMAQ
jgi:uncharacterized repeat protein (TIGR01451 family)